MLNSSELEHGVRALTKSVYKYKGQQLHLSPMMNYIQGLKKNPYKSQQTSQALHWPVICAHYNSCSASTRSETSRLAPRGRFHIAVQTVLLQLD